MPKVRKDAVMMVRNGKGIRETARYFGFNASTISRWVKRAPADLRKNIPTKSSRPHSHPRAISQELEDKIIEIRLKTKRCSEVVHEYLKKEGIIVSLSTVKRTLDRAGLLKKKSKWKKYRKSIKRPEIKNPGDLVQIDTIHMMYPNNKNRIYIYTLLDVYSRWTDAWATQKISAINSIKFLEKAKMDLPFNVKCIQSDHGPEFSKHFTRIMNYMGHIHRFSRVRTPNDNAHLERFNRTIQEECLWKLPFSVSVYNQSLSKYIKYYNTQRLHLGIDLKTPLNIIKCCKAID